MSATSQLAWLKPIDVTDKLLDDLVQLGYGDRRTSALLSLLFPHMAEKGRPDKDHLFPISRCSSKNLLADGVPALTVERIVEQADRLPNLQLMLPADNSELKHKKLPKEWLDSLPVAARRKYAAQGVKYLPADLGGATQFLETRKAFLRGEIGRLLG